MIDGLWVKIKIDESIFNHFHEDGVYIVERLVKKMISQRQG